MRLSIPVAPSLALTAAFLLGTVGTSIYAMNGMAPSGAFLALYFIAVGWSFSWWVLADCRRLGISTSIDHGWFVFHTWPLAVPYHLLKTRRLAGCAFVAGFFALFVATWVVAIGVYFIGAIWRGQG